MNTLVPRPGNCNKYTFTLKMRKLRLGFAIKDLKDPAQFYEKTT